MISRAMNDQLQSEDDILRRNFKGWFDEELRKQLDDKGKTKNEAVAAV